jgi:hypothetical protein
MTQLDIRGCFIYGYPNSLPEILGTCILLKLASKLCADMATHRDFGAVSTELSLDRRFQNYCAVAATGPDFPWYS